jgi:hypothetical protein
LPVRSSFLGPIFLILMPILPFHAASSVSRPHERCASAAQR